MVKTIDAKMLSKMFLAGAKNLEEKKEWINELNVFPVPDGDTGTNMTLTIMSAAKEVSAMEKPDMAALCKAVSSGSLRGARGNSGVILSQLFRGFTKGVRDYEELDTKILADAFEKAVETAYKAVMKPKEGTILTVAKGGAQKARELADGGEEDLTVYFEEIIKYADEVLAKTPDLLPVLKQAGVVDSGGQGLMQVLKGAYEAFCGKEIDFQFSDVKTSSSVSANMDAQAQADIKFGYCTEFIIMLSRNFNIKQEMDFKAYLESIGDSIVVVADDGVVKVHVHTNDPGMAIQKALKYGALSNMKIDNMRLEHQEKLFKMEEKQKTEAQEQEKLPKKEVGFIAVSAGDGIQEIFKGLGVDYVIEGGQTMNPSTADILDAVEKVNADTVFILPNNKNIILAAEQAKALVENRTIHVIPTKNIPQGFAAALAFSPEASVEENKTNMIHALDNVKSGQVTHAVRTTSVNGFKINEGDIIGLDDKKILAKSEKGKKDNISEAVLKLIEKLKEDYHEVITLYYGEGVKEEDAAALAEKVQEAFSDCDVDCHYGGQPVYYYLLSLE